MKLLNPLKAIKKIFTRKRKIEGVIAKPKVQSQSSYIGVPAPVILSDDAWFGAATKTEKVVEHVKQQEEVRQQKLAEEPKSKEPENIHQKMYEMATRSGSTTIQLNPIGGSENFQGGSENIHR